VAWWEQNPSKALISLGFTGLLEAQAFQGIPGPRDADKADFKGENTSNPLILLYFNKDPGTVQKHGQL
jgi:hypothetical protein